MSTRRNPAALNIRIPRRLRAALEARAALEQNSITAVARRLIAAGLRRERPRDGATGRPS